MTVIYQPPGPSDFMGLLETIRSFVTTISDGIVELLSNSFDIIIIIFASLKLLMLLTLEADASFVCRVTM